MPIQLDAGFHLKDLNLKGNEIIDINIDFEKIKKSKHKKIEINIFDKTGEKSLVKAFGTLRIDTTKEFDYIQKGNILNYVLNEIAS